MKRACVILWRWSHLLTFVFIIISHLSGCFSEVPCFTCQNGSSSAPTPRDCVCVMLISLYIYRWRTSSCMTRVIMCCVTSAAPLTSSRARRPKEWQPWRKRSKSLCLFSSALVTFAAFISSHFRYGCTETVSSFSFMSSYVDFFFFFLYKLIEFFTSSSCGLLLHSTFDVCALVAWCKI